MNQVATFIGLDLGSFKSAVAASNGRRTAVPSVLGWPSNEEARERLGRDFVCGGELTKQTVPLDVIWPFRRGLQKVLDLSEMNFTPEAVEKHREAGRLIARHIISLTTPNPGSTIYGIVTTPGHTSLACKQALFDAVRDQVDAVMFVPEAFCIAFGAGQTDDCLVIDMGAGKIDICPLTDGYPAEDCQITLAQGCEHIELELVTQMKLAFPDVDLPQNAARQIKESVGCLPKPADTARARLNSATSSHEVDVTEPLRIACRKLIPTVVGAVREVIGKFEPTAQRRLLSNVLLTGAGSQLKGFPELLTAALVPVGESHITVVSDPVFGAATGALKLSMAMPLQHWEQVRVQQTLQAPVESVRRAA